MELNITKFVETYGDSMERFSDSIANSGLDNIGEITWKFAADVMADESNWFTDDLQELRDHFIEFGAWDHQELDAMTGVELNALLAQFISGDYREYTDAKEEGPEHFAKWDENFGGNIFECDDGKWYYHIGI